MIHLLTLVHVIVCLVLILVVLLQSGKAADLAGAFGGMGSQTAFGPRGGATLLSRATTICAVIFMITSLSLAIWSSRAGGSSGSILEQTKQPATAPAKPGQAPAQKQQGTPIPIQPQQQQPANPAPPAAPKK